MGKQLCCRRKLGDLALHRPLQPIRNRAVAEPRPIVNKAYPTALKSIRAMQNTTKLRLLPEGESFGLPPASVPSGRWQRSRNSKVTDTTMCSGTQDESRVIFSTSGLAHAFVTELHVCCRPYLQSPYPIRGHSAV
jgi:hypothetical protein